MTAPNPGIDVPQIDLAQIDKVIENPFTRIVAGVGLLLTATILVRSLLFALTNLVNLFERGRFESLWNLDRTTWVAIMLVTMLWVVFGLTTSLDTTLLAVVAGAYLFWIVIVRNIAIDLPEILRELFFIVDPLLAFGGLALGFLALSKIKKPMGDLSINFTPASAKQEPGWFPDPKGEATYRWWDGEAWTDNTH